MRYGQNQYNETVEPYTIYKSAGQTYNVTGVHEIERRFEFVKYMGTTSGEQTVRAISANYTHPKMMVYPDGTHLHVVDTILLHDSSRPGDSGAPIYVINKDGDAEIVGAISGALYIYGNKFDFGFPWDQISDNLDLADIP